MYTKHNEPSHDRSPIFITPKEAINYCLDTELIDYEIRCCSERNTMSIIKNTRSLNGMLYRCKCCKKEKLLFSGKKVQAPKILLNDYFYCIYKFWELNFEKNVLRNANISKKTYQKIKGHIYNYMNLEYVASLENKIGGQGVKVEIDETAIAHGVLVDCPSNLSDEQVGVKWLVGMIEENSRKIKLFIVENRKSSTILNLFQNHLYPGTIIVSDGYPSYPSAVSNFGSQHIIVNHSIGFKNLEGFTTNNIENLWNLLKYEVKRRRGVLFGFLQRFVEEFVYRYNNLRCNTQSEIIAAFRNVVEYIFNE